jgi:S1-C subfamily serine protease
LLLTQATPYVFATPAIQRQHKGSLTAQEVAAKALRSVVLIKCTNGSGEERIASGFFVTPTIIATNYHVVEGMLAGVVQLTNGPGKGEKVLIKAILEGSKKFDVVLLHVPTAASRGKPLQVASDIDRLKIGETIYALGNPEGLTATISTGIVSAIRVWEDGALIQITAPISAGSSGGPVIDAHGRVVGMVSSSLPQGQNLNFAVPSPFIGAALRLKNRALAQSESLAQSPSGEWLWLMK